MNHQLLDTLAAHLTIDPNRWPDRHGDYHADCPYCRKPAKKGQTHFRISRDGLCYCQVCQAGSTLSALAEHLNIKASAMTTSAPPQTEYDYYDTAGALVYQVVRYVKQGKKSFFQRHMNGDGSWVNGMNGVDRVLYRLPEVTQAIAAGQPIYVVEGEKDVETLRLRGLVATTNVGGAGKWHADYSQVLAGATVFILPDNDAPGEAHAQQVKQALRGIAKSARIVRLPDLAEKEDVSDWLNQGHTIDELTALTAERPKIQSADLVVDWQRQGITLRELQTKYFDPERWIIERILPEGACLFAAKYKSRKSWIALALGLAIAMGGRALGQLEVHPGRVLYLDLEGKQQRIKKRTRAILGVQQIDWPENFHVFTKWPMGDEGIKELEQWFRSYPDTVYVPIDVLGDFRRPIEKHEMGYAYDRITVQPLNELSERYHAAFHLVHHFNKAKNDDIMDSISGTTGLPSAVNTMWGLARDPNDSTITILHLRGRDLEDDEPLALRWDNYLNMHVIEGPAREVSISAERKAVLALLSDDEPRTPKDIATTLERSVPSVQQLLRKLLNDGLIDKPVYGKYAIVRKVDQTDQTDQSGKSDQSGYSDRHVPTLIGRSEQRSELGERPNASNVNSDRSDRDREGGAKNGELSVDTSRDPLGTKEVFIDKKVPKSNIPVVTPCELSVSVFDVIGEAARVSLRAYLRKGTPAHQEHARELCEQYGIEYARAYHEVNGRAPGEPS